MKKTRLLPKLQQAPERPIAPTLKELESLPPNVCLDTIQAFLNKFEYNFSGRIIYRLLRCRIKVDLGKPFVKMKKNWGAMQVMDCAREIISIALPIQCVEATFLGLLLTTGLTDFVRIPVSFKSVCDDGVHRHMILAIYVHSLHCWGAIGISRRADLMNKPVTYASLYALMCDYRKSYEANFHQLLSVAFGAPFPHQYSATAGGVQWKHMKLRVPLSSEGNGEERAEEHSISAEEMEWENMCGLYEQYIHHLLSEHGS